MGVFLLVLLTDEELGWVDVYYLVRRSSLGSDTGNSMMQCQRRLGRIRDRSSDLVDLGSVR